MGIPNYGVVKGTITDKQEAREKSPHYQLQVEGGDGKWRVAINVKSDEMPPNLLVFKDDNYTHPELDKFTAFTEGYTALTPDANSGALDFIRGNLFDMGQMVAIPGMDDSSGNDLNEILGVHVQQAMNTNGALVYAFGSAWPDDGRPDQYFGFSPSIGIHDIHMNQGNDGYHAKDNGVYQDGALFIYYPDEKRWLAMYTRFQSQTVHTDDNTAEAVVSQPGQAPEQATPVAIIAALVNPVGPDPGHEQVYLLNTSPTDVDLTGWAIVDKANNKDDLSGTLAGGETLRCTLNGQGAQLSNKGGIISLLNKDGLKVSGVSYTADDAQQEGKIIRF
jgi:uncharacterized protein YukJ